MESTLVQVVDNMYIDFCVIYYIIRTNAVGSNHAGVVVTDEHGMCLLCIYF